MNAAISRNAPNGSDSWSPVAPISGGYVPTISAATNPAHGPTRMNASAKASAVVPVVISACCQ